MSITILKHQVIPKIVQLCMNSRCFVNNIFYNLLMMYIFSMSIFCFKGWHRECFKCADCAKRLDSVNCCEGPDKDIYCKGKQINCIIFTIFFYFLSEQRK